MSTIVRNKPEAQVAEEEPVGEATNGKQPLVRLGRDDRKCPRCAVPKERQPCEVKVGADVLLALLIDKSANGFGVLIDRLDGLKIGQKVELHTDTGQFKVQIVHIKEVAPPKDIVVDSCFRLGMKKARKFFPF